MNGLAIVSGGMDSVTMLNDFSRHINLVLTFDYGAKHNHKEIPFAKLHAKNLGKKHVVIDLDFFKHFKSNLLKQGEDIPDGHYQDEVMKKTVVPFRNGIMLSIAAGLAESNNLDSVWIANHFGDHAVYPDCREDFVKPMSEAVNSGTYANIKIKVPYIAIDKRKIALIGKGIGIDYGLTWSCYKGLDKHCGTCGTCVERQEALMGFDETLYLCTSQQLV